jgi:hypothetical protein
LVAAPPGVWAGEKCGNAAIAAVVRIFINNFMLLQQTRERILRGVGTVPHAKFVRYPTNVVSTHVSR